MFSVIASARKLPITMEDGLSIVNKVHTKALGLDPAPYTFTEVGGKLYFSRPTESINGRAIDGAYLWNWHSGRTFHIDIRIPEIDEKLLREVLEEYMFDIRIMEIV